MKVQETHLEGCYVITPAVFKDSRGCFFESFNHKKFKDLTGINFDVVQTNQSISNKGVLRGLHYQEEPYAQAKLVRVIKGKVLDICVDLRKTSKTFGQHFALELSSDNNTQLFIPRGFAHGFITLEDHTIFSYHCDNYYNKASENGIIYNDPQLNLKWPLEANAFIISERDLELPKLQTIFK
ncbi:MAG: dTDP-4-dehydrorhamnose 3,5-epimerase [Flavobacteriaceae bacterium]|nr:dTDP-4-dehydrorhamnose 3,5-epimerase [Flavobacteriaceae bacterium]